MPVDKGIGTSWETGGCSCIPETHWEAPWADCCTALLRGGGCFCFCKVKCMVWKALVWASN